MTTVNFGTLALDTAATMGMVAWPPQVTMLTLPSFRCFSRFTTGTQYGPMAVHVIFFNELMSDEIRGIWHAYRTASLMGHCGRNVAWDYILERMNCEFKDGLHGCVTRERLDKFGVMMNGFKLQPQDQKLF